MGGWKRVIGNEWLTLVGWKKGDWKWVVGNGWRARIDWLT